jgi:hypothetical protein
MLEIQRIKSYMISRMRAKGATDEEINAVKQADHLPFRPAYENGKRRDSSVQSVQSVQSAQASEPRGASSAEVSSED